jgi:hypothetical protein
LLSAKLALPPLPVPIAWSIGETPTPDAADE